MIGLNDNSNDSCLVCGPIQVITVTEPIKDINDIEIYDNCNKIYNKKEKILKYAYSLDSVCWSCWMDYDTVISNTIGLNSDFFVRFQIRGQLGSLYIKGEDNIYNKSTEWSSSLLSGFNFSNSACNTGSSNPNQYNPYTNMDCAIGLQQQLTETVGCMFGVPCYYFKVSGNKDSADITFKEYALKSVIAVKQIKIIVPDGQMPSSKPEFADFGLDWQTDFNTEIPKGMFASAFGNKVQPTEGDFVYIPMMKRMWMVNEAYEEKSEGLMWIATTFKLALVKYQDDMSVDKDVNDIYTGNNIEDIVSDIVKNKYEDLFGNDEPIGSGETASQPIKERPDSFVPVFESDATRSYVNIKPTEIKNSNYQNNVESLYYKGTMIADSYYDFTLNDIINSDNIILDSNNTERIEYQHQYCGSEMTLSFLIYIDENSINNIYQQKILSDDNILFSVNNIQLHYNINKESNTVNIYNIQDKKLNISINYNKWYFIVFRYSNKLNLSDISASEYTHKQNIPLYKLNKVHYYFDIDNMSTISSKYNTEFNVYPKQCVIIYNIPGFITNIKLYDIYNSDMSELLMQLPTSEHLLINDICRPIMGLLGVEQF